MSAGVPVWGSLTVRRVKCGSTRWYRLRLPRLGCYLSETNCDDTQRPAFIDGIIDRMVELSGMDCLRDPNDGGWSPELMQLLWFIRLKDASPLQDGSKRGCVFRTKGSCR